MHQTIENMQSRCLLCGSSELMFFYDIADVPASCNLLWTSRDAAINCPKGSIQLALCSNCSFIANYANEPEKSEYGNLYDNSLFYSGHFQNFAKGLTTDLIQLHNLNKKNIVEVGCGKVDFLSLFCELGGNRGLRINPLTIEDRNKNIGTLHTVGPTTRFQDPNQGHKVDFVFSYHELEHINNPLSFLNCLRKVDGITSKTQFFFAVPNARKAFEKGDITDVIYEHVSYFTIAPLRYLFSSCGFKICNIAESKNEIFESIYVSAIPKEQSVSLTKSILSPVSSEIVRMLQEFSVRSDNTTRRLSQRLTRLLDRGKRIVIWGAGARGVTILNILRDPRIEYAVDVNPNKQGKYVPGTGQKIVSPDFLLDYRPDFVILANPSYRREIKLMMDSLGIETRYIKTHE